MIKAYVSMLAIVAAPAIAQVAGNDQSQANQTRAQSAAQARAQAAARARFQADMTIATPAQSEDPGRTRPGLDQQQEAATNRNAPSPYGSYYRIRTPWDPR